MKGIEETPSGGFRVRVRVGGRHLSQTITPQMEPDKRKRRKLAEDWKATKLKERELGTPQVRDQRRTLNHVIHDFERIVIARKAPKTQGLYKSLWNAHLHPEFGDYRPGQVTPALIEEWLAESEVGTPTKIKALVLLGQIFKFAMKNGDAISNPVWMVDKPAPDPEQPVDPPTPVEVERVRKRLLEMDRPGEALFVSLVAYGGLRPFSEALALPSEHVRDKTLLVHAPKTGKNRAVDILDPLREDLDAWDGANGVLIPHPATEAPWTLTQFQNWRSRVWNVELDRYDEDGKVVRGPGPKDLRHTFISLLLRDESYSRREVADQAGHTLEVQDRVYSHVFAELRGTGSAAGAIREAREEVFG